MPGRKVCTCEVHCHGGKEVARATWYRHRSFWRDAMQKRMAASGECLSSGSESDASGSLTSSMASNEHSSREKSTDEQVPGASGTEDDHEGLNDSDTRYDDPQGGIQQNNHTGEWGREVDSMDRQNYDPEIFEEQNADEFDTKTSDSSTNELDNQTNGSSSDRSTNSEESDDSLSLLSADSESELGAQDRRLPFSFNGNIKVPVLQQSMVKGLQNVSLDNGDLSARILSRLRNPEAGTLQIED
ncbi:hypothetical protein K439DRAFT_1411019 [Ramaria rubella]|nr:hypothetical protein K439DRAFT_1411019 [Ramaria rubella]